MYIQTFHLSNYKSYRDVPALDLKAGFNVITGRNNSGKTALLEALGLNICAKPHRSLATVPSRNSQPSPHTSIVLSCLLEQEELASMLLIPSTQFGMRLPKDATDFTANVRYNEADYGTTINLGKWLLSQQRLSFKLKFSGRQDSILASDARPLPSFGIYVPSGNECAHSMAGFGVDTNREIYFLNKHTNEESEVGFRVADHLRNTVYSFRAERFNAGRCDFGSNTVLAPNAENLAEVLNVLQHDTPRFADLNQVLHYILPDVQGISVRPVSGMNQVEIVVWNSDNHRADLTVPLNECGTGIGQVLAVLYVVLTAHQAKTIIIDEPQSFLHPGAARKLIDVLAQHSQHQYIIATHSPTIIAACNPRTITVVRNKDGVSTLETVDISKAEGLRSSLAEVGATLSDVFGADNILWVEGPTEEICFPKILSALTRQRLMGTVIRGVRSTGDFEPKHADALIDIYNRMSGSASLLPPARCFIFDHELRTPDAKTDILRRASKLEGGPSVIFTKRRMYENYLLHAGAVAAVLNSADDGKVGEYDGASVETLLLTKLRDKSSFKNIESEMDTDPESWVDAASLLHAVFAELTNKRVRFDKVKHSVALTVWLLAHEPERLREVADLLTAALGS